MLKVVCEPHDPMSHGPASVSWYMSEKSSGFMPSTSATYTGSAITEPVPFSWAPVMIVPVPSPLSLT